jgi:hypothetical protein
MASASSGATALPRAYHDFQLWVGSNMVLGVDGHGNRVQYVPYRKLEEYWDWERIANFPGIDEKTYSINEIKERLIVVLSILVYISDSSSLRVSYLHNFYRHDIDDHKVPLSPPTAGRTSPITQYADDVPQPFPQQDGGAAVWKAFDKFQWQFCPILFRPNGRIIEKIHLQPLDVRHIRPVTVLEELPGRGNGAARLLKVKPHQSSGLPDVITFYQPIYAS